MAIVAVLYEYNDDIATRDAVRPEHRKFLDSQPNLLLTGPTDDEGAIILFDGEPRQVEVLMDEDPFWDAGVIASRRVTVWDVTGGSWKDRLGI
jgi:uncharacterized protein YciI